MRAAACRGLLALAVLVAGTSAVPARAEGRTYDVPPSIDATGTTDVTEALNAFLARVPDGSDVRFPRNGRFRVDGTLLLVDHHDLEIHGQGSTIFATTPGDLWRGQWTVRGGGRIAFRHLAMQGVNPHGGLADAAFNRSYAGQHGFRLEGVAGLELDHVRVDDVYGDLVYVGPDHRDDAWSSDVWIHHSHFADSGRQGITVVAGRRVIVEHNEISHTRRATIDLEPGKPTEGAENIHVLDNRVGPGRLLFVAAGGNGPINEVVVARNQLTGRRIDVHVKPPPGDRRRRFAILDNSGETEGQGPQLRFERVDAVLVAGNRQQIQPDGKPAVRGAQVCGMEVRDNDFVGAVLDVETDGPPCGAPWPAITPQPAIPGRGAADHDVGAPDEADDRPATAADPSTPQGSPRTSDSRDAAASPSPERTGDRGHDAPQEAGASLPPDGGSRVTFDQADLLMGAAALGAAGLVATAGWARRARRRRVARRRYWATRRVG